MQRPPRAPRVVAATTRVPDRSLLTGFAALAVATATCLLASGLVSSAAAKADADHATSRTVVKVAKTKLGSTLVNAQGRTLYVLTADSRAHGKSVCYAACAKAWPPLLTKEAPRAGHGVRAALLGVAKRTNGTTQVTYNGERLYLFVKDTAPKQTNGQKLKGFGGPFCTASLATKPCIWYALSPAGVQLK